MPDIAAEINRIQGLLAEGNLEAALGVGQEIAQRAPARAEAWFWLGFVELLRGKLQPAEAALARAIELDPKQALSWTNFSIVALGQGRAADAEYHARQAIDLDDASDTVWINLGSALFHQERFAEAADAYRQAVARQPRNAAAWSNVATAEAKQGHLEAAQDAYERSLSIAPDPQLAMVYATLLVRRQRPDHAIHILQQIVDQIPDFAAAWIGLGDVQTLAGETAQAEAAYRRALAAQPGSREAQRSLTLNLLMQFRFSEAEALARGLVDDFSRDPEAWALLAMIQQGQAKAADALASYRRSVAIAPDLNRHSRLLVAMQYLDEIDAVGLLAEHRAWSDVYAGRVSAVGPVIGRRDEGRELRIGFCSANFGRHPIAFLALPAMESLDRKRCSVVCYSDRLDEDEFTIRFREASDTWNVTVGMTDKELAQQIRRDEIDVLIDLMGHTSPRLLAFAMRPAPAQLTWLGYVGTTGLAAMDFLLADRHHVRPGEESWYTETVLRLPHCYACYAAPAYAPDVTALPAAETGRVTFGSFNNPAKLAPRLIAAWAAILQRVPDSRLLLKFGGLDEPQMQADIRRRFAAHGIGAERLILEGRATHPEFLAAYGRVDLALDTQPYSGGVTTCEALWMGVPVVTFPGRTFAGRHSTSYLSTAGLSQFVAEDMPGYIELAVSWAGRQGELASLRRGLRDRIAKSPVGNAHRFAGDLLAVLTAAHARRQPAASP